MKRSLKTEKSGPASSGKKGLAPKRAFQKDRELHDQGVVDEVNAVPLGELPAFLVKDLTGVTRLGREADDAYLSVVEAAALDPAVFRRVEPVHCMVYPAFYPPGEDDLSSPVALLLICQPVCLMAVEQTRHQVLGRGGPSDVADPRTAKAIFDRSTMLRCMCGRRRST